MKIIDRNSDLDTIFVIRDSNPNSVTVAEEGGLAIAEFFYQADKSNKPRFVAYQNALRFIEMMRSPAGEI